MNGIDYLALLLPFLSANWAFSYISEIELLSKKGITSNEDVVIRQMLHSCFKINHSQSISDLAINLKRANNIKLPDAIIAASAQQMNLPLLTADKGFTNIKGLDCIIIEF